MTSPQVVQNALYEAKRDESCSFVEPMFTLLLPKFLMSSRLLHQLVVGYNCASEILHNSYPERNRVLSPTIYFKLATNGE